MSDTIDEYEIIWDWCNRDLTTILEDAGKPITKENVEYMKSAIKNCCDMVNEYLYLSAQELEDE